MKIVCVFAHPDDESFGVGGTIASLSSDHDISLICCTDGNHQDKNLKSVRKSELQNSAEILGIKKVYQLDFEDGHLCNANYHELAAQIKVVLDDLQPDTVITFHENGVSGHLDHIAVTSVVNYLFDKLTYLQSIWYYTRPYDAQARQDYFVYRPDGIPVENMHKIIDTVMVWDQVVESMRAHVSQNADGERIIARHKDNPKKEHFLVRSKE